MAKKNKNTDTETTKNALSKGKIKEASGEKGGTAWTQKSPTSSSKGQKNAAS